MSTAELSPPAAEPAPKRFWGRVEDWLIRAGERLNPILVKEARQAMKSRLFSITFGLVLLAGWVWSIWGIAKFGPGAAFQAAGPQLFFGYYLILAAACIVVVPYGAFRSLASECEDRTFELLSITTLGPRQIVAGKLGSAVLQLLIMFSALAPCLTFTYLLRGIDIVTIVVALAYIGFAGLGLSMIALLLATLTQERNSQNLLSVALLVGLLMCFSGIGSAGDSARHDFGSRRSGEIWSALAMIFTFYATTLVLCFLAAAARLTVVGQNRSTPLRVAMLAQFLCGIGWFTALLFILRNVGTEGFTTFLGFAGGYWYFMGVLMTGELAELSPRVRRSLPQTRPGKATLAWFFPGPGRGYLFAVANLATGVWLALGVLWLKPFNLQTFSYGYMNYGDPIEKVSAFGVLLFCYVTIYLGLGKWILSWLRRWFPQGALLLSLVLHAALLGLGAGAPFAIAIFTRKNYTLLQLTNPFWTLNAVERGTEFTLFLLVALPLAAVAVLALNFPGLVAELRLARTAQPERVAADEAARLAPRRPTKTSPWDGGE